MAIEVRHLKLIRAVVKEGGITRACSKLHLTQSALSHQLRYIEDQLGTPLFLRVNKKMVLTQAGERLLDSAQIVLDELRRTEDDIRAMASNREGILRISTECYTCYHWLPRILKLFGQSFAGVEVRIVAEATRRPVEALLEGKIDLAITSGHVRNSKMSFKPLFKDELVVVMAADHELASRPWISAHDFTSQHLITYALPKEELTFFKKVLIPAGVSPRKISRIELTEAIIEMVKAGLGITVMAQWAVAPYLASGSLRAVPLTKRGQHRQWYGATLKAAKAPAYVSKFVELAGKLKMDPAFEVARRGS